MEETANSPDDFATAFEASFARFQVRVEEACAGSADWTSGVRAAIQAAFEFAADEPAAAHVLTNEALAAGADGHARRRRLLAYLAERLAAGRALGPDGAELPTVTESAIAGGLAGLVAERLALGKAAELPDLAPQGVQFALTPYLGAEEAHRIATAPNPPGDR